MTIRGFVISPRSLKTKVILFPSGYGGACHVLCDQTAPFVATCVCKSMNACKMYVATANERRILCGVS